MMSRTSIRPAPPEQAWYRHVWPWLLLSLLTISALLLLLLDPLARYVMRKGLSRLHGYRADFCEVHISLLRPSVQIYGLRLQRTNRADAPEIAEPILFIDRIEALPVVEDLFQQNYIGVARVSGLSARVAVTPELLRRAGATLNTSLLRLDQLLRRLLPLRIDRIEVHDGELQLVDGQGQPLGPAVVTGEGSTARQPLVLNQIEATIENFSRRPSRAPTTIAAHLRTGHSGELSIFLIADPRRERPTFAGQIEVQDLQLSELYDLLIPRREPRPMLGTLDLLISFKAAHGTITGAVKPVVTNVERDAQQVALAARLRSDLHDSSLELFDEDIPPREEMLQVIPIHGQLADARVELWPTVMGVVGNAFGHGLASGVATARAPAKPKKPAQKHASPPP